MENLTTLVLGRPGMGKSTYLENDFSDALALRDRALFFIEPHGESVYRIADAIPRSLIKKTRIIDPLTLPLGFDPLIDTGLTLTALQSIWADSWGDRMDYILLNILITLKENDLTLASLHKLVFNPSFRQKCIARLETNEVRAFWKDEFPKYEKDRNNPLSPILNKVQKINLLPRDRPIKSILCQKHPALDFAEAIIDQHIVLVNLNKGFIGDEATTILGALTTAAIMQAVLYINRPLIQSLQSPLPVGLWADEFPTYGTSLYRTILMEFRKLGLNRVTLASQHVEKIDPKLRADIFNAALHKVIFSVEPADAEILAENYRRSTPGSEHFNPANIAELPPFHALIDGREEQLPPFTAAHGTGKLPDVIAHCQRRYT